MATDDFKFDGSEIRREREDRRKRAAEQVAEGRKLYSDSEGRPNLRQSFAVYVDALGTKSAMKTFNDEDLRAQTRLLDDLNWFLHDPEWQGDVQRFLSFSDNVVLGIPIHHNETGGYGLGFFLDSLASYQYHMTLAGRFQRGGIATGMLYIDERFVTGPVLVEAVVLEQEVAVYPRIVLSEPCAAIAVLDGQHYGVPASSPWNSQLLVDADGRAFVDYLSVLLESPTAKQMRDGIADHRDCVEAALATNADPGRIREKYRWAAEYHNHVCDRWRLAAKYRVKGLRAIEELYPRSFRQFADHVPIDDPSEPPPKSRRQKTAEGKAASA